MNQHKSTILLALKKFRGDDLERAQKNFKIMTPEQMQEQHGESGLTRQELLSQCETHTKAVEEATAWVEKNL